MKYFLLSILFLQTVLLSCSSDKQSGYIRISPSNPHYLEYQDGTPYIPIGPNICWERFEKDEEKVLALYEQRFRILSENGGNYTRIWLSAPFFEVEHEIENDYDDRIRYRIDKILEYANKYDIKVKFCFENFRKLTNQPAPFLTSVPFDKPIYSIENNGSLTTMEEYFMSEKGKELFINKVNYFSEHYAQNSAVFGWELWNEINSVSVPNSPTCTFDWTKEMLTKVKSLFPNHLVMQSLGSFDNTRWIDMYNSYMNIQNNEIAQVHRYLDLGASWDICHSSMDTLASNTIAEIRQMVSDKPIILSEVGAVENNHSGPWNLYQTDTLGILLHDMLFAPFFSGAAGPGQSWHWDYYIEKQNLWWHYQRFSEAIKNINPIKEHFNPFYLWKDDVRLYGLDGTTNTITWCRDARYSWHTELVEKVAPEERSITLPINQFGKASYSDIQLYNPWLNTWSKLDSENDSVRFHFTRSAILRIKKN